ncbi:MAG: transcriptional repressor [Clostridiales bacterium]|nr:transcriptional repressor [Clostridiales bacterium]
MTRQRTAVLEAAVEIGRAFTVEDLAAHLRRRGSGAGLATVYRAVAALVDAGTIARVGERGGSALWVHCAVPGHHHHLVCTECGRVAHSTCELGETTAAAATAAGFSITGHDLTLWGVCAECAATTPWTANREDVRER